MLVSIISDISADIYYLRLKAIKNLLDSEIIKEEAHRMNIPVDTFIKLKGFNPEDKIRSDSILTLLRNNHNVAILLPPPSFQYQEFENMYSYDWIIPNSSEFIVVLFNYDCSVCFINDKVIREIGQRFNKNIKYIYYTNYVTNYALLCDAAMMQDHFWEMHDRVLASGCTESVHSLMKFADSLGMDTLKLAKNMNDKKIMKKHLANSQIIQSMEIFSVPVYIFQNSIYHDIQTLIMGLQAN